MKILIIDNLFSPNLKGKVGNGAQKFSKNQMELLSTVHDTYYITAVGSDKQYDNQYILDGFFDISDEENKRKQTRGVLEEIKKIIIQLDPDVVLDNSCKHMSSIWENYKVGIIFEHYHKPSSIISKDRGNSKFSKKGVYWCGVSKWQAKKFLDNFDDTICIHYINEPPSVIKEAKPYGIFVGRWDAGKYPQVALKNYLKSGANYPVECFIKFGGTEIPAKELENLQKSPLFKFYIDAPRQQILDSMSEAMFGLGMGNESTGIVCLEYVTHGVPYIVPGNKTVAESEHIPAETLYFCDRFLDTPMPEQIRNYVDLSSKLSYTDRVRFSETVVNKYTAEHFIKENMRIIHQAVSNSRNNLECFMM